MTKQHYRYTQSTSNMVPSKTMGPHLGGTGCYVHWSLVNETFMLLHSPNFAPLSAKPAKWSSTLKQLVGWINAHNNQ